MYFYLFSDLVINHTDEYTNHIMISLTATINTSDESQSNLLSFIRDFQHRRTSELLQISMHR